MLGHPLVTVHRMIRRIVLSTVIALLPAGLRAQERRHVLPELRFDTVLSDVGWGQLTVGAHVNTGAYVRLAFLGGAGVAWTEDESGTSYRAEVQGRFHLDPLRSSPFGLYGIGGVSALHDTFAGWQSRLVLGAGVEVPSYARGTLAVEAALAGGLRLSVVTRRVTLGRRRKRNRLHFGGGSISSDCGSDLDRSGLGWLDESLAKHPNLTELLLRQLAESVGEVSHRVVEPLRLIFGFAADDPALHDVLKHFVAGLLKGCGRRNLTRTTYLFLCH